MTRTMRLPSFGTSYAHLLTLPHHHLNQGGDINNRGHPCGGLRRAGKSVVVQAQWGCAANHALQREPLPARGITPHSNYLLIYLFW